MIKRWKDRLLSLIKHGLMVTLDHTYGTIYYRQKTNDQWHNDIKRISRKAHTLTSMVSELFQRIINKYTSCKQFILVERVRNKSTKKNLVLTVANSK